MMPSGPVVAVAVTNCGCGDAEAAEGDTSARRVAVVVPLGEQKGTG